LCGYDTIACLDTGSRSLPDARVDLWALAKPSDFDGSVLLRAIEATFERWRTAIPQGLPIGFSDEFINVEQKGM
jgi:hypothetical protein